MQLLPAWWGELAQADGLMACAVDGSAALPPLRARLAQGLRDLQHALGGAGESGSFMEVLQALLTLVEDPQASLPASLATALVLTQDRLADLKLRKHLAARDPDWPRSLIQSREHALAPRVGPQTGPEMARDRPVLAVSEAVDQDTMVDASEQPPTQPSAGRDWWAVPVEGLLGSNQLFLIETRELLRSAELSLQALRLEPADYAEQMVLCRSFQAVAVAAASMGLHPLAVIAAEGERRVDERLEGAGVFDAAALADTDHRLQQLYVELMDLVGETVPAAAQPLAPSEVEVREVEEPVPSAADKPSAEGPAQASGPEPESDADALPATVPQPSPSAPPRLAPWWWAMDWSAWPSSDTAGAAAADSSAAAEGPADGGQGVWPSSETMLRLAAGTVQGWVAQLLADGHDDAQRQLLARRMEDATCIPLESWSVTLFRTARRVAREQGRAVDFDMEGAQHRIDAEWAHRLMPVLEQWVAARVGQGLDAPLRLNASLLDGGLRLRLGDGVGCAWPDEVCAQAIEMGAWMALRGGALRAAGPSASTWELDVPALAGRVPLVPVRAGSAQLYLPSLWVVASRSVSAEEVEQLVQHGTVEHEGQAWPAAQLSALIRSDESFVGAPQWVFLQHSGQRLALLVEPAGDVVTGRPIEWPQALAALPARAGLWGIVRPLDAAAGEPSAAWPVTDPFALHQRFGAAARVLARSRARRPSAGAA